MMSITGKSWSADSRANVAATARLRLPISGSPELLAARLRCRQSLARAPGDPVALLLGDGGGSTSGPSSVTMSAALLRQPLPSLRAALMAAGAAADARARRHPYLAEGLGNAVVVRLGERADGGLLGI
jgi:hypothetical protein